MFDTENKENKKKLDYKLEKEEINWQPQVEKKWLASLLKNEKAVIFLLKFLKTTRIKKKEGAKEREIKWARKYDQKGENIFE